ncbi:MAG TPA: hypothetical protein VNQ76_00450, partial [Planctomicrobium sp.]|nr:hypothetical protein [Planctomicrobium sp.]
FPELVFHLPSPVCVVATGTIVGTNSFSRKALRKISQNPVELGNEGFPPLPHIETDALEESPTTFSNTSNRRAYFKGVILF